MDFGEKTCFANPGGSTLGVTPGGAARDEVLRREPSRLLTWKHFDLSPSEMALKSSKPPQNQEPRPALITPGDPPAPEGDKDPFFHRGRGAAQTHTSPVWNPPPHPHPTQMLSSRSSGRTTPKQTVLLAIGPLSNSGTCIPLAGIDG